jgi:hypothetical protein
MNIEAILVIVAADVIDLIKGLTGGPTPDQITATIKAALIKAADQEIVAEYPQG